jgi:hypothetical protein
MIEALCPSCGGKVQVPEGQALPRCRHCWSPLVAVAGPGGEEGRTAPRSTGLDALFEQYAETAGPAEAGDDPSTPACCQWCGAISEPGLFCSECGSPLLEALV